MVNCLVKGARKDEIVGMASLDSVDMNLSKLQEIVSEKEAWHAAEHGSQSHTQWRNYIKVSN